MNADEKGSFWKHSEAEGGSAQRWMERRDVATSRRPHIVTSQRRDVGSTFIEVNKRQRRDVSANSASQSLKAKRGPKFEGSEIEDCTN